MKYLGIFFTLAAVHIFLGLGPIRDFSPTYDEPVHLTAGYTYWKTGDYRYNGLHHPPFGEMWAAIPLIFMNPVLPKLHPAWIRHEWNPRDQYQFADAFLYHNRIPADNLMRAGRGMQLFMSVIVGALIMVTAFTLGGSVAAFLATFCWALSPAFLANGTIVSTDLAFAFFYFGFFAFLLLPRSKWKLILSGVCLGLGFASKYFALAFLPSIAALWFFSFRKKHSIDWASVALVGASAFVSLAVVYGFSGLDIFWMGLSEIFTRAQAGRSSFFWGHHSVKGSLSYFPFVFAVKTPLPLLIGLIITLIAVLAKKISIPPAIWVPPLLFFLMACFSKVQIGHRHLLAVYPFLFVIVGIGVASIISKQWWIVIPFAAWMGISMWMIRPNYLAYFNELVGGSSHGYKYLTDSNVDWGQGLKMLGRELSDNDRSNGIFLSYFGVADPHAEGIRYLDVGSDRIAAHEDDTKMNLKPTKFAISVTNLQCTYYENKTVFDWLKNYEPVKKIGHSIFLYDFSNAPEALTQLEKLRS